MDFLSKIIFFVKKPKVIIITGSGRQCAKEAIFQLLKSHFKIGRDILLFESDLQGREELEEFKILMNKSSLPILAVTHIGDIPPDKDFFAGERQKTEKIRQLAKIVPSQGFLILNFDDETAREIADITNLKTLSFGFQEGVDFRASDVNLKEGTNFKINHKGNIVPVWLKELFGKEQIYSALAAASVGAVLNLNLVEISQNLKNYQSLPGKMRLIKGKNNSRILDDSEGATVFSMAEALEILGKIPGFGQKIAVLGDVVNIGKYTIEAHEAIGERAEKNANLLFTFGLRADFISQGARQKGMAEEKIFHFNTIEEGISKLKETIKEGDLILVDGSKEMEMGKIVKEING